MYPFLTVVKEAKKSPQMRMLDLPDFLIMPVQRLPRIELLLKDILKYTEPDCKDYKMTEEAYEKIKQMTASVNQFKKESDSIERLKAIQHKVRGKKKVSK